MERIDHTKRDKINDRLEEFMVQNCKTCKSLKEIDLFASKLKKIDEKIEKVNGWAKHGPLGFNELGNSGWNVIHSIAAYYPNNPTEIQKQSAKNLINAFSELYPCDECAQDLKTYAMENPIQVDSRKLFSQWTCEAHNHVNLKTNKPKFSCELFEEFWGRI